MKDAEFGEQIGVMKAVLSLIKPPTMMITADALIMFQSALTRAKVLLKHTVGFEAVIGRLDSIQSIVEEMLYSNLPVMTVDNETKQIFRGTFNSAKSWRNSSLQSHLIILM